MMEKMGKIFYYLAFVIAIPAMTKALVDSYFYEKPPTFSEISQEWSSWVLLAAFLLFLLAEVLLKIAQKNRRG